MQFMFIVEAAQFHVKITYWIRRLILPMRETITSIVAKVGEGVFKEGEKKDRGINNVMGQKYEGKA